MADALQQIENLNPTPPNYGTHESRVATFRSQVSRHVMLRRAEPFFFYAKELLTHFTKAEMAWLVECFSGFAAAEIVAGKASPVHIRMRAWGLYGSARGDDARKYFLTPAERRMHQAIYDSVKRPTEQKIGNPTPIAYKSGRPIYQIEGPRDRLIRRLKQGKYLYGDLGGLTGGFAFVVSKDVMGNDFDSAVEHGAVVSAVTGLVGGHFEAKAKAKAAWGAAAGGPGPVSQVHVGQPAARVDPIRIIPALPSPADMGSNANASMLQLLKTLNQSGR